MAGRAGSCPRCCAPLSLREEPAPRALDRDLTLDRRGGGPRVTPPFWAAGAPEPISPDAEEPLEAGFDILGPVEEEPFARLEPEAPAAGETEPGRPPPPARRLLSWGVDAGLAVGLAWLLTAGGAWVAGGADEAGLLPSAAALAALLHFAHATLGHALAGRTLGKWSADLRLVGPDGRRPGPGRAAVRALLSLAAAAPLGLGLWPALWDRKGRTMADRILQTSVIRAP